MSNFLMLSSFITLPTFEGLNFNAFTCPQLAHGADPFLKNQEGQTPVDLASADDVRSLLQDAMATHPSAPENQLQAAAIQQSETVVMPSGASVSLPIPYFRGDGCTAPICSVEGVAHSNPAATNIPSFLNR